MSLRYLSTEEAAKVVGVGETTMRTLITEGGIPWTDIGRNGRARMRVKESDLQAWMDRRATQRAAS